MLLSNQEKERLQWEFRKLFPGYASLLDYAKDFEIVQQFEVDEDVENEESLAKCWNNLKRQL